MPKRKHHKKKSHRRRVGAMSLSPTSPLVIYGSMALGYFLGDKINTPIDTAVAGKVDSKIIGVGEAGIGFLLAFKGKKSTIKTVAGGVLIGAGAKRLLKDFGVVSGFRQVPVLSGFRKVPVIGSYNIPPVPKGMGSYNVPPVPAGVNGMNYGRRSKVMGCAYPANGSGINPSSR
jgi:hypothetical protein